jgi:hypothetical protein
LGRARLGSEGGVKMRKWIERFFEWRERKYWAQSKATDTLHNARRHLYHQYYSTASGRDRGFILSDTQEALDILHALAKQSFEVQITL